VSKDGFASRWRRAGGHVTEKTANHTSGSVTRWDTLSGEPFTFDKDMIPGRKWRVAWGWLEVDAMGGWKPMFEVADSTDLARKLAWLSGANVTHRTAQPELIAA
jgi:hypothetical protein